MAEKKTTKKAVAKSTKKTTQPKKVEVKTTECECNDCSCGCNCTRMLNLIFYCLLVIIVLLGLILVVDIKNRKGTTNSVSSNSEATEEVAGDYDVSDFDEITAKDISGLKGTNVIYVGRSTCSWCVKMLPNLQQAQKDYKYTTKYIDIAKIIDFSVGSILNQNAYDTMINLETSEEAAGVMDSFGSTPMMLIVKDGKIVDSQVGYSEYSIFATLLENNGFSK